MLNIGISRAVFNSSVGAAFARRKRRKAARGKIVDFSPGPPRVPSLSGTRLRALASPVAKDCLEFRWRGSNPPQSRRSPHMRLVRQPPGGGTGGCREFRACGRDQRAYEPAMRAIDPRPQSARASSLVSVDSFADTSCATGACPLSHLWKPSRPPLTIFVHRSATHKQYLFDTRVAAHPHAP